MSIRFGRSGGNYSSSEVMQTENDDWRKIEDVAERRRIQNRLAQRNYRRKLRAKLDELEKQTQQTDLGRGSSALSAARVAGSSTSESSGTRSESSSPLSQGSATGFSPASYGQQITLSELAPDSSDPFSFDMSFDKIPEGIDDMFGQFIVSTPIDRESPRISGAGDNIQFTRPTYQSDLPAPFGMPETTNYWPAGYLIPPTFSPPPEDRPMRSQPVALMGNSTNFLGLLQDSPGSTALTPNSTNTPDSDSPSEPSQESEVLTGGTTTLREELLIAMSNVTFPPGFHEFIDSMPEQKQRTFIQTPMSPQQTPPVPSDHRFITLQFNSMFNASILNSIILSIDSLSMIDDDTISPFNNQIAVSPNIPKDLEPTKMQKTVPHHPYIDIVPFPGFRDKMLRFLDMIDEDDVCSMMRTDWGVWGSQPWEKTSWEVGEKFAEKYWFLMDEEMKKTSDFWRGQRGLKPLKALHKRGVQRGRVVGEV